MGANEQSQEPVFITAVRKRKPETDFARELQRLVAKAPSADEAEAHEFAAFFEESLELMAMEE